MYKRNPCGQRMPAQFRIRQLLDCGLQYCKTPGNSFATMSRSKVAEIAGCTGPLFNLYFGNFTKYKAAIIREAIRIDDFEILAQCYFLSVGEVMRLPENKLNAIKQYIANNIT